MTKVKFILTAALTVPALVGLAASSASAQGIPLSKRKPLLDKRALTIPGKLPMLQQAKTKVRKDQRIDRPPMPKRKGRPNKRPTPPPPPPPSGGSTKGYGQIKKSAGKRCRPMRSNDKVQFEFKAADIKDVVSAISKTMCKNFIITQKVRSQKFDIISPTPITVAEAWRAFLSALQANDFTLVQAGKYYKIIQATDGTRSPVPLLRGTKDTPNYDRMVTKIWKLEHATDINAVVNYLNIFKSGKGQIHPFHATGTIVATDFGSSMVRLETILSEVDQPGVLERVHVVSVDFAGAQEIADKLTQIFEPNKAAKGSSRAAKPIKSKRSSRKQADSSGGGPSSVSKIIADERTNSLIIIASDAAFKEIMALKRRLDVPGDSTDGLVHVLSLKHADAEELASTLSSLASGTTNNRSSTTRRTSSRSNAAKRKTPAKSAALFQGEVKVTSDKATNSLVITASKGDLLSVRKVIEQLDVPRFQVFVEAVILEISMSNNRNLGLSFYGGIPTTIGGEDQPIFFGNAHNELNALQLATNPLGLAGLLGFAGVAQGPTLSGSETIISGGIPTFGVVMQALQSSNNINVVSTPHLLTLDNQEAEIQVNERRPFPQGLSLGGLGNLGNLAGGLGQQGGNLGALGNIGGLGLGSVAINREDVGLTLKLKPQINDLEYVRLEIDQELSDVAGTDQVTQQTITSKRAAKTVVVVRDQDSVVIGGLVRDRESIDESKVPLLGDIPLIGWLFKRQQKVVEKVNLLLVITPYIIRGPDDFRKIYERKMKERKEFVDRFYGATPEYKASVDWSRKSGPLARFRHNIRHEMLKVENGGPGMDGEVVVESDKAKNAASKPSDVEVIDLPDGDDSAPPSPAEGSKTPPIDGI